MRVHRSRYSRSRKALALLWLSGMALAGCSESPPGVEVRLQRALESIGAAQASCPPRFGGENASGVCFDATVTQPLPDVADVIERALVEAGLSQDGGEVRCLKLTQDAPKVMGNCAIDLNGSLRDSGYDLAFLSGDFTPEQLSELDSSANAYPDEYRVFIKIDLAGSESVPSALPN